MKINLTSAIQLIVASATLAGCASGFTTVSPKPPQQYSRLGEATGSACGTLLLGPQFLNFIPIRLNSRVERAYQDAINSVPGATSLINVTMKENWFEWGIGSSRCVTISGEAIK